jgi:hypothetical protein
MAIDFSNIKIFVEGTGDKAFIRDILKLWYKLELSKKELDELILDCKGFAKMELHLDEFQQINKGQKREGGVNIVIFDADSTGNGAFHGFNDKLLYLEAKKKELGINFETYLFPDNATDGTIETLLETCINPVHQNILDCWHDFETCVNSKGEYNTPANKSKIYVYLECLHGNTKSEKEKLKDHNRDFTNKDIWQMDDYNDNPSLLKLKQFLDNQLQQYYV